jgi:outer membrane immunogenic protein
MGNRYKLYCTVATAAVLASFNGAATAADLPTKAAPLAPAPVYAPNWTGFYIGGHIGYGWSKQTGVESGGTQFLGDNKLKGGVAGVHGGYNYQFNQVVLGVEADVSGTFGNRWNSFVCTSNGCGGSGTAMQGHMHGLASIRGRLGWAFNNSWMVFATGGWGRGWYSGGIQSASAFDFHKRTVSGGIWGGGLEWKYSRNLSFRLEGLTYRWHKDVATGSDTGDGTFRIHPATVFRLGATYHFN